MVIMIPFLVWSVFYVHVDQGGRFTFKEPEIKLMQHTWPTVTPPL